jgi:enoyl-CoA hydratase/carnithine racemase
MIDAQEAYRIGLANRVVPADRLMAEARAWAEKLLQKPPVALRLLKEAMIEGYDLDLPKGLAIEAKAFANRLLDGGQGGERRGLPGEAQGRLHGALRDTPPSTPA